MTTDTLTPRQRVLAYQRAYNAAHREERLAYQRAYDAAHREERRAYQRAYDAAHREERRAYQRAYNAAHRVVPDLLCVGCGAPFRKNRGTPSARCPGCRQGRSR